MVAVLRLRGRVRGSTQEVDMSETHVLTMRDGKAAELHEYPTREEALEVAGLQEKAASQENVEALRRSLRP